jgi:hypothetical protein
LIKINHDAWDAWDESETAKTRRKKNKKQKNAARKLSTGFSCETCGINLMADSFLVWRGMHCIVVWYRGGLRQIQEGYILYYIVVYRNNIS